MSLIPHSPIHLPVVHEYVGTLDVSVEEVLLVTEVEAVEQLLHAGRNVVLVKVDEPRLEQTHQVVVHVLKHQVKRA